MLFELFWGGGGGAPTTMAAYLSVELPISLDLVPNKPSASSKHSTASVARASWNRASMFLGVSPTHLETRPAQFTICTSTHAHQQRSKCSKTATLLCTVREIVFKSCSTFMTPSWLGTACLTRKENPTPQSKSCRPEHSHNTADQLKKA